MLFVGDDWAEDHHDVEVQDPSGRVLGRARLPEGVAGVARLHELIGAHLDEDCDPEQVAIGIETDRGPWVQALLAAGYRVYAVNPRQVSRFRDRHGPSGAKSDTADAHTLADMVRTDRHQLRTVAGDSAEAQAVKVVARAHQTLIWDRHRHMLRLRAALREFFPGALAAFADLTASDALELLSKAPDPARAAQLSRTQVSAALKRARRRDVDTKAEAIVTALRSEQLTQPPAVAAAYAATVQSLSTIIATFNSQIAALEKQVTACFGRTRDAEICLSQPGLGQILAARVLGEFGDDPERYASAKARKNYAGTSPITQQSGKKKVVLARFIRNDRLADPLHRQAFCALSASPGARNVLRPAARPQHEPPRRVAAAVQPAGRHLARLPESRTLYDEHTAWRHHVNDQQAAA